VVTPKERPKEKEGRKRTRGTRILEHLECTGRGSVFLKIRVKEIIWEGKQSGIGRVNRTVNASPNKNDEQKGWGGKGDYDRNPDVECGGSSRKDLKDSFC